MEIVRTISEKAREGMASQLKLYLTSVTDLGRPEAPTPVETESQQAEPDGHKEDAANSLLAWTRSLEDTESRHAETAQTQETPDSIDSSEGKIPALSPLPDRTKPAG